MVDLEVGGTVYVVRGSGYAMASRPFLKITAHPTSNWHVGYRMATSRDMQSYEGLDSVELELPVGVIAQGQMQTERGLHQEFSAGRKAGRGTIQVCLLQGQSEPRDAVGWRRAGSCRYGCGIDSWIEREWNHRGHNDRHVSDVR